jgi:hypothetical protein
MAAGNRIVQVTMSAKELMSKDCSSGEMVFDQEVSIGCTTDMSIASRVYAEVQAQGKYMCAEVSAKAGFEVSSSFAMSNSAETKTRKRFVMPSGSKGYVYQMHVEAITMNGDLSSWSCNVKMTDRPLADLTTVWRAPGLSHEGGDWPIDEGTYLIHNPDGNRHPDKFVHIPSGGQLMAYGPMDEEHRNDGNRHFVFKKWKIWNGTPCYTIHNAVGNRHPNKYLHISTDGGLYPYGPMDAEHQNDLNRHFAVERWGVKGGKVLYLIYNPDGDRKPNSFWHVASNGDVYPYGPMSDEYRNDVNRHFALERIGS